MFPKKGNFSSLRFDRFVGKEAKLNCSVCSSAPHPVILNPSVSCLAAFLTNKTLLKHVYIEYSVLLGHSSSSVLLHLNIHSKFCNVIYGYSRYI